MRTTSNHVQLRGALRPESTPNVQHARANESVERDESDARRHPAGTCSFARSPIPNPHKEVIPSSMIVLLLPTRPRDASTSHAPMPIPDGEPAMDVYWPTATALTEARRRHIDRGHASVRAPGDEGREESATGARRREADRCASRTKADHAIACSCWCSPDAVVVRRAADGVRDRVAVGFIPPWLLAPGFVAGGLSKEDKRIAVAMQEVARATIGSEGEGTSGSREPSPASHSRTHSYVQHHFNLTNRATGTEALARDRLGVACTIRRHDAPHGADLRRLCEAPRLQGTRPRQHGPARTSSSDPSSTARRWDGRMEGKGALVQARDPEGVAPRRTEEALAASGSSVGGPGSCSRGCRGGAIRCCARVGLRQGSPAEGLRPSSRRACSGALSTPLTVTFVTIRFSRCFPFWVPALLMPRSRGSRSSYAPCCVFAAARPTAAEES